MLRERHAGGDRAPAAASEPSATGQLRVETLPAGRLRLVGEADETTREAFETAINGMANGGGDLHLDLAQLAFIDVAGVGALVQLAGTLGPNRRLVLHQPPPGLRRILDLLWPDVPGLHLSDPSEAEKPR